MRKNDRGKEMLRERKREERKILNEEMRRQKEKERKKVRER